MTKVIAAVVGLFAIGITYNTSAPAAEYPTAPIKLLVPFPAGGLVDTVMRIVVGRLTNELHQPIVIENRAGAAGSIATAVAARSPADGYTIVAVTDSHATNPLAIKNLSYDAVLDFSPIALIGSTPLILTVGKDIPVNSVSEFVALAKTRKSDPLSCGSLGSGSAAHLASELFKSLTGTELNHIPYKGGAPAINDLLAGHIDSMFLSVTVSKQHYDVGALKPLAIAATSRIQMLPNVPTMKEVGIPMKAGYWIGLLAPAKTPSNIIEALSRALEKTISDPTTHRRLADLGFVIDFKNPLEFQEFMRDEIKFWETFVKDNNIHLGVQ
ncbi:tripartite tricarboxylate transporter substrate binding protein [Bradyrhizobium sp. 190]|uniref:Bug family tripartite tricarboxylate transporter substrate binding protein n=1 Tax=Bradyrhizobium sp. 190 TaxID=2782658 RepID=UPI001FF91497|nr:tripartite tricarboxylate transporter substrate binding protein [Bradyrhizobium sp. 190]MCK1513183.1 tripartite tricarboxylate transporter substrate binding protein [Bradyrhizobium sp. 190]